MRQEDNWFAYGLISFIGLILIVILFIIAFSPRPSPPPQPAPTAVAISIEEAQRLDAQKTPLPTPIVETDQRNYSDRYSLVNGKSSLIWCTTTDYSTGSQIPPRTYPLQGSVTFSDKRPYSLSQIQYPENRFNYEQQDPNGMYGSSGSFWYGKTLFGSIIEFSTRPYCTSAIESWQISQTTVILRAENRLSEAQNRAKEALKEDNAQEAVKALEEALKQ